MKHDRVATQCSGRGRNELTYCVLCAGSRRLRRGLSDSRPTIRAYREAYATLKDLPGRAREGQFGAVNRVVGAWDVYRRYPFTICGGVLLAAAPFLSKGN